MRAPKHDFVTLDGLRGVAAIAIVTRHLPAFFPSSTAYASGPLFESYLAVDFFFVLSGFVLMHAYGRKLHDGMSVTRFMAIRLIRLYPLYVLALGLALSFCAWGVLRGNLNLYQGRDLSMVAVDAPFAILMLPSPASEYALFPLNYVAWSLFFELIANAVFGLMGGKLTTRWVSVLVAVSGFLLCCAVTKGWFGLGMPFGPMLGGFDWQSFGAGVLRVSFSFFAGVLTYLLWDKWQHPIRIPPALIIVVLIAILSAHPPAALGCLYDLVITVLVFPGMVLIAASSKPNGIMARTYMMIGLASYGIYVLQVPVYEISSRVLTKMPNISSVSFAPVGGTVFIAVLFLLVLAADYFYDVPVRRWLSAHLLRQRISHRRAQEGLRDPPVGERIRLAVHAP
jgi:peptidoglycan/LPS O-acetylase OafA/YrhL